MTGFDEEIIRENQSVIDSVNKCVALDGRDFTTIMDEVVSNERKRHDEAAAKIVEAAVLTSKDGALGPGVKEFRELIK